MTEADIAYMAALLDNMAALRSRSLGPSVLPVIQISGKHAILDWVASVTGTKVIPTVRSYTRHQCTEHCPDRHNHLESSSRRWSVTGMRATIILAACEPFMKVQGAAARSLIDAGLGVQYQGQVVNDMRDRGWPIPELSPHERARIPLKEAT